MPVYFNSMPTDLNDKRPFFIFNSYIHMNHLSFHFLSKKNPQKISITNKYKVKDDVLCVHSRFSNDSTATLNKNG